MKSTNRPSLQQNHGSAVWTLAVTVVSLALIVLLGGFGVAFMGGVVKHKAANAAAEEAKAVAASAAAAQTKSPVAAPAPAPVAAATPAPTPAPAPAASAPAPAPTPSAAAATAVGGQATGAAAAPGPGKVVEKDGAQYIEITTHPMQFLYMVNAFTVKAGKKVRIDFKNTSTTVPQPHNLIICKVGKKGVVEAAAMALMTDPKAMEKGYVPESEDILVHSKLLQPNESEIIEFTAPAAGTYDYLCTFPGHWILMKGVMTVE